MEFNNSTGLRSQNQPIFFQNPKQGQKKRDASAEQLDEQEILRPPVCEEDYEEEEMPVNDQNIKTKHPFTSSELFNAFSKDNSFRENKSIVGAGPRKWINDFSPNKEVQSRGQSMIYQEKDDESFKNPSGFDGFEKESQLRQQMKPTEKYQQQQQKIFFGPLQIDNNYKKRNDQMMDDDDQEDGDFGDDDFDDDDGRGGRGGGRRQSEPQDDTYNQDEEGHMMTEQDFDGHYQDEEYSMGQDEAQRHQEEYSQDQQYSREERKDDSQFEVYEQSKDQREESEQEDDEGEYPDEGEEEGEEGLQGQGMSDDEGDHTEKEDMDEDRHIESQECNILQSSQSVSPGKEMPCLAGIPSRDDDIDEDIRESGIRQSSATAGMYSTNNELPFNQAAGNVVVERNDRFIIFKMVPQANVSTSIQQSNPSFKMPAMGEKYRDLKKDFKADAPPDEIQSDEERKGAYQPADKSSFNFGSSQDTSNLQLNESGQELHSVSQNDIKSIKNQLINQSLTKPPIVKKMMTVDNFGQVSKLTLSNHQSESGKSSSNKNEGSSSGEQENEKVQEDSLPVIKKSLTLNQKPSSGGLGKQQTIGSDAMAVPTTANSLAEFTLNKGPQQMPNPFDPSQSKLANLERRQSDSVVVRSSTLQQPKQQELISQQQQYNLANSQITNPNTAANDTTSGDPETELLKMEYMKLKKTLNKLKQEPAAPQQQTARKNQSKQGRQDNLYPSQQNQNLQQLRSQPLSSKQNKQLEDQKSQIKSKKNLKLGADASTYQSNITSVPMAPEEEKRSQNLGGAGLPKHQKGVFSQQQSAKAGDSKNKNLFKQQQQIQQEQQTVPSRGYADNIATGMKRDISKNKLSQKTSPVRQELGNKRKVLQAPQTVVQKHHRNKSKYENREKSADSLQRSPSSYSSPDKSYRTYQKPQHFQVGTKGKKLQSQAKGKQQPSRKRHQQNFKGESSEQSSDEEGDYREGEGDESSNECDHHHHNDESLHYRDYSHGSQGQHHEDSYYDSNIDISNKDASYGEEGSSDEEQEEDSQRSDSEHSSNSRSYNQKKKVLPRKQHKRGQKGKTKGGKPTITTSHRDRKLKININMNGHQYSRQARHEIQNSQDEYLQKQRQLLQQQQYLMAMAQQLPQQQLLLQQQLALQQQMLIQQPPHQQIPLQPQMQFMGMPQIAQAKPLPQNQNVSMMSQQPQVSKAQQPQPQQAAKNIPASSNVSLIMKQPAQKEDQSKTVFQEEYGFPSSQLKKNLSGNNIAHAYNQSVIQKSRGTLQVDLKNELSPQRSILQNNFVGAGVGGQYPLSQIGSPRDTSATLASQRQMPDNEAKQQQQNANYLNQLKNRFKTGATSQNTYLLSEEAKDQEGVSRNQMGQILLQNNSSPGPIQSMQKDSFNPLSYRGQGDIDQAKRFEEARRFVAEQEENYQVFGEISASKNQHHQYRTSSQMHTSQTEKKPELSGNRTVFRHDFESNDDTPNMKFVTKKTGEFPQMRSSNVSPMYNKDMIFSKAKDASGNGSANSNCDISLDEGVKASNAHETMLRSPRATNQDFKQILSKNAGQQALKGKGPADAFSIDLTNKSTKAPAAQQHRISYRPSKSSHQITNDVDVQNAKAKQDAIEKGQKIEGQGDQDKKGPQALWIGFEDETQLRDPFQNKPALKARQQQLDKAKDLVQRSKSTKGTAPSAQKAAPPLRRALNKNDNEQIHDKQLRSPIMGETKESKKQQVLTQNLVQSKESPLKRVVMDIKQKENVQSKGGQKVAIEEEEEAVDPSHNTKIMIEIFDNKKNIGKGNKEVSLADMFISRKKAAQSIDARQQQQPLMRNQVIDQDNFQQQDNQMMMEDEGKQVKKGGKSKEELAELRKKMMKSKIKKKADNFVTGGNNLSAADAAQYAEGGEKKDGKAQKDPKQNLMIRLAMGQKIQVDKKEMKKLTNKNYEKLPEIQRKKEEEKKKAENMARKAATKEYMKALDEKRKALLKKKKSVNGGDD